MLLDKNEDMLCPLCKEKLTIDSQEPIFRYDAAMSTISSYKYICTNKNCDCNKYKSFWNDFGDFWCGDMNYKYKNILFPDDKFAALNSLAKKQEIEIYGIGLKRKIYLSPWLTLKWLQPMIEFKYKGDEMGNVLGRTWKLIFLYKDSNSKYYSTHYTSPIMLCYHIMKSQRQKIKNYKKNKTKYNLLEIWRWFDMGINRGWERKFPKWFYKKFYNKYISWSKNTQDFLEHLRRNKTITEEFYLFWKNKLPPEIDIISEMIENECVGDYLKQKIRERKLKRILNERKI